MKYAAAWRYGGELADAAECKFEDFNYLRPLCPECGDPVRLRLGGDRTSSKGKSFTVVPHWAHFRAKDPALVQQCEERVSRYSEQELKKRSAQATGQRLKLFQRWFWSIINQLPMSHVEGEILGGILEPHFDLYSQSEAYRQYAESLANLIANALKATAQIRVNRTIDDLLSGEYDYLASAGEEVPPHLTKYVEQFKANIDLRMQKLITLEAIRFLCSPKGRPFLMALNFNAIVPFAKDGMPEVTPEFALICIDNIISLVGLVPWAKEFEQVQKT